ncbi:MAG: tungsten cofactor oxidoreductase radical SAM maturase [Anaerolineales bacterium]
MPEVKLNPDGTLNLPADFLKRRHLPLEMNFWLDERNGDIILHPCLADIQKLYIEPTTVCNLKCITCIRNVWNDPIEHMQMSTFQNILASLSELKRVERVIFTSFGEPLSHPRILEMVESIRKFNIAVTIGTNGLLLTDKIIREMIKLGVDRIMVSMDGGKPETYAGIRGAMLAKVIEHIQLINQIKQEMNTLYPAVGIEFVALKSNIDELQDVKNIAAKLNVSRLLISHVLPYTEEMRQEMLYSYQPADPYKATGWPMQAGAWVIWGIEELPRMYWGAERRCRFINDHAIVVGWDGGVSPCYALSHNYSYFAIDGRKKNVTRYLLGNVNQQTLTDIWTSEEYVRFRSEVMAYRFPSCPNCDLRETCDLRERNEGCWGWNPSCADCLWAQDIVRCP